MMRANVSEAEYIGMADRAGSCEVRENNLLKALHEAVKHLKKERPERALQILERAVRKNEN